VKGMCVTCGKPAMSPYVDGRFCHICGLAFGVGLQEGLRVAINLIDPEPMSCDCRIPLCKDRDGHEYGCSCGGVTTLPVKRPTGTPATATAVPGPSGHDASLHAANRHRSRDTQRTVTRCATAPERPPTPTERSASHS